MGRSSVEQRAADGSTNQKNVESVATGIENLKP